MVQKQTLTAGTAPPVTVLPDSTLIQLALGGETECFSALMDRHLPAVEKRIRWMVQNEADSDDLVQDVVLKIWRQLATFRSESGFRTWMMRVAINEVLQAYRRERRMVYRVPADFMSLPSAADSPQQVLVRVEQIQAVRQAVVGLPEKYRRVLVLRDLEELSAPETAQRLQATIPVVKTRLFRARRMLRVALNQPRLAKAA